MGVNNRSVERVQRGIRHYARGILTATEVSGLVLDALTWSEHPEATIESTLVLVPPEVVAELHRRMVYLADHQYDPSIWNLAPKLLEECDDSFRDERRTRCRRACDLLRARLPAPG